MDSEHSPTSTATAPDDMASYTHTDYTSTNTSPHREASDEEWYDSKTPQLEQDQFHYNQADASPDLELLQHDFSYSHSFKEHATSVRKSVVLSDSLASVALHDHTYHEPQEHQTQLAMTNSPSFSALANILERKEAKFKKSTPIIEENSPYQPSPLSTEQKGIEESPNLIQFDDETPRPHKDFQPQFNNSYNTLENDIFKTPDVPQSQRFPHQEYTSMLAPIESSPSQVTQNVDSEEEEESRPQLPPAALPKPLAKNKKSPLLSEHYNQRSASMPVVVNKKETKEKRRSFMNFFKTKRSVSSSSVPKKSSSFSVPSPSLNEQHPSSSPLIMQLKGSKSFTLPKSSTIQEQAATTKPQPAQRSASSTSLFSAFKRKKSQTFTQEQSVPIQPVINIQQPKESEDNEDDLNDDFSVSSEEFNEDFNNLNAKSHYEQKEDHLSTVPPSSTLPASPIHNKRLSQISQGSKRYSQISQGETIFPKNLSAQEVESIVSLERNRSLSRQSMNSRRQSMVSSHRQSMVSVTNRNYVEQNIPHKPSFESMSGTSIQLSPGRLNTTDASPEYIRRDYLAYEGEESEEGEGDNGLFDVEEFSHRLEFDTIADNYSPEPEDISSQFAEFADYIDFGDGLELDLGFDDPVDSPLSQPALFNSPQVEESEEEYMPSPQLSQRQPSPLSSPFLQQSAYVPSLQRPVSMSFRGLKAPAFNTMQNSDSVESFQSSQRSISSFISQTPSLSSSQPKKNNTNRRVMFSSKIVVFDVNASDEYDRTPDVATCNQLTPQLAMRIKAELNELKREMEVHEDSRCYIHFL